MSDDDREGARTRPPPAVSPPRAQPAKARRLGEMEKGEMFDVVVELDEAEQRLYGQDSFTDDRLEGFFGMGRVMGCGRNFDALEFEERARCVSERDHS